MADASRAQTNGAEKVPKFRASCDSCHEAKVRCSQTRPSCARCAKGPKRRCVYGVSKRLGKPRGEGSKKTDGGAKNGSTTRSPATPISTTEAETPSSSSNSSSTIDPREVLQLFPASRPDSPDLLKGQQLQKEWTFDNNFFVPDQTATSPESPATYDHYQFVFGKDEDHVSNDQNNGHSLFDSASDADPLSCSRDNSIAEQPPSYTVSDTQCVSCSMSNHQSNSPSTVETCRCNEIIITQLSLLPVLLLNNDCSTFDVELVQFQKAIRLCAGVLACTCRGKDFTSVMTISMLMSCIISVFERGGAQAGRDDDENAPSLIMTGVMTPIPSPKIRVGAYEIEGEDENYLKREVWWMQIRKVESLILGFKEMVAKMTRDQLDQDNAQVVVWEKLVLLLDQKFQAVKRDWSAHRDKT